MQDFDIACVEMRTVTWSSGWQRFCLRRHQGAEGWTELVVDDVVMLHLTGAELLRLRDALDALDDDLPYEAPPRVAFPTRPQKPRPANTGKPWAPEDDEQLATRFRAGETAKELADVFGRSAGAVQLRLVKIGLVEPQPNGWRGV